MIAPASTGRERSNSTAVIVTDHTNSGIWSKVISGDRILIAVVMKLAAPRIDLAPARWREKMAKSTDAPECAIAPASGGYTVHPVPAPESIILLEISRDNEGGKSQNLILFIRGNAISGAPIIRGTIQFPNPPIMIGITIKKIIMKACAVTTELKIWSSQIKWPGVPSSIRIISLKLVPTRPAHTPKIKYNVPMSLWLVENNHFVIKWLS